MRAALADAEQPLRLRSIGPEQYLAALAEADVRAGVVGGVVGGVSQRKPVGPRRAVPHRQNATGTEVVVGLSGADGRRDGSRRRRAGCPAGAAVVLDWDSTTAPCVEGATARLKRLVESGWLVEENPGRIMLPTPGQVPRAGMPDAGS